MMSLHLRPLLHALQTKQHSNRSHVPATPTKNRLRYILCHMSKAIICITFFMFHVQRTFTFAMLMSLMDCDIHVCVCTRVAQFRYSDSGLAIQFVFDSVETIPVVQFTNFIRLISFTMAASTT